MPDQSGDDDRVIALHTDIGREGVILEIRSEGQDFPSESDMSHLSDSDLRRLRNELDNHLTEVEGSDVQCPDCGADLNVLYVRREMKMPTVTGWCPESGKAKAVPLSEVENVA